jgi:hypothetical protein
LLHVLQNLQTSDEQTCYVDSPRTKYARSVAGNQTSFEEWGSCALILMPFSFSSISIISRAQTAVCLRVHCAVADTGPGIQADRFQDYFPQYSKPCFSALHPSAEQWSSEVTWGENWSLCPAHFWNLNLSIACWKIAFTSTKFMNRRRLKDATVRGLESHLTVMQVEC